MTRMLISVGPPGGKFWVAGIGDQIAIRLGHGRYRGVDDLPLTLSRITTDDPVLLMVHEPDIFPRVPARVALTLLVFDRTGSPLLAAVTYVASLIPLALGGVALSGLADRLPRREVMICCDLGCAALAASALSGPSPPARLIRNSSLIVLAQNTMAKPANSGHSNV